MSLFKKVKLIKSFFLGSSPHTVSAILNVPLSKVYDWRNGRDVPSEDQINQIKNLNFPLRRLKRALADKATLIIQDVLVLVSRQTIYPFWRNRCMLTRCLTSFRQDPKFLDAYAKGIQLVDHDPESIFRIHQLIWAASVAINNEGDWVELGTGKGMSMSSVLHYHHEKWNNSSKNLWLVDTFSPYDVEPETSVQNKSGEKNEFYCDDIEKLKEHFEKFNNIQFLQGLVPDCLDRLKVDKISFLHIDLNHAKPEIAGLSFLWDKLIKGGILLLDDYGGPNRRDQHDAMNKFAASHSFEILATAGGQGLAIK